MSFVTTCTVGWVTELSLMIRQTTQTAVSPNSRSSRWLHPLPSTQPVIRVPTNPPTGRDYQNWWDCGLLVHSSAGAETPLHSATAQSTHKYIWKLAKVLYVDSALFVALQCTGCTLQWLEELNERVCWSESEKSVGGLLLPSARKSSSWLFVPTLFWTLISSCTVAEPVAVTKKAGGGLKPKQQLIKFLVDAPGRGSGVKGGGGFLL